MPFKKGDPNNPGFKKGKSGNPGGIPIRSQAALKEVKSLAQQHGEEALQCIINIMRDSKDNRVQVAAAREILDRGYGKSVQPLVGEGGGPIGVDLHGEALYLLVKKLSES